MREWLIAAWPGLVIFAIVWAANHIHDKLESIENLLIDIRNSAVDDDWDSPE